MADGLSYIKKGTTNISRLFLIINAAGYGDKLLEPIGDSPAITRLLEKYNEFSKSLSKASVNLKAVIVTESKNIFHIKKIAKTYGFDFIHSYADGGDTRTVSVFRGLEALDGMPLPPGDKDIVYIHDAAWCDTDTDTLYDCFNGVLKNDICCAAHLDRYVSPKQLEQKNEPDLSNMRPAARANYLASAKKDALPTPLKSIKTSSPSDKIDDPKALSYPQCFRYYKIVDVYSYAISHNQEADSDGELAIKAKFKINYVGTSAGNIKRL